MTFQEAKDKLSKLTESEHDQIQKLLANLHTKLENNDKATADAIELASIALILYTNGGK